MVKRPLDTASRIAFLLNTIPIGPDESQESLYILRFKTLSFLNLTMRWSRSCHQDNPTKETDPQQVRNYNSIEERKKKILCHIVRKRWRRLYNVAAIVYNAENAIA